MKNEQLRGQYTLTRVRCSKISTDCPRVWLLQVSFRTSAHRQSFTVEVCVIDKNDNVPSFIEESMRGSVQLGLLKGTSTLSSKVTALLHLFPIGLPLVSPATRNTITHSLPTMGIVLNVSLRNTIYSSTVSINRISDVARWTTLKKELSHDSQWYTLKYNTADVFYLNHLKIS